MDRNKKTDTTTINFSVRRIALIIASTGLVLAAGGVLIFSIKDKIFGSSMNQKTEVPKNVRN